MVNIKDIQKKYEFHFKSFLGQNFFNNDFLLEEIIESLNISKDDIVLEIGPGFGVLTEKLLCRAKKVISVEIDSNAVFILNEEFKDKKNFLLINEDFLKMDLHKIEEFKNSIKVIANIPYYITTPIIEKLFKSNLNIDFIAVMVQKEVGERILATPSTKEYGSLTVFVNYYSKAVLIKKISSNNFIPKPKVDSVFIKFEIFKNRFFNDNNIENEFLNFVKRCFSMRRKNLFNVLTQFNKNKQQLQNISHKLQIDFNNRAENLDVFDFQKIFVELSKPN